MISEINEINALHLVGNCLYQPADGADEAQITANPQKLPKKICIWYDKNFFRSTVIFWQLVSHPVGNQNYYKIRRLRLRRERFSHKNRIYRVSTKKL